MEKFKFCAECLIDTMRFIEAIASVSDVDNILIERCRIDDKIVLPDVTVTFEGNKSLDFYRRILNQIVDSHVMLQSINLALDFTGDRYYVA